MLIKDDVAVADEALVAAVRQGDDRAFEQLYARYQRRIASYVLGMVGDHGRAEDVTQEVFISALRRMRATERPIAFKPWIYEIAKNACIDQFRRTRRTDEVSLDAGEDCGVVGPARLASAAPTPDAAVDAKQQLDDLCGAFGGLSDAHHQILVLRELEGLSYQQIGDRLSLSRPSVESTLFRARKRLTEEYEELVSGERCRAVQTLVADGIDGLGGREKRRLARHVAHCQPCRRQAHHAGVDTLTLTRSVRTRVARRVAAFLPLPAFLRRDLEAWSAPAAAMAEPAAGYTKAAAVAVTMLVAGGAGMAGHAPTPSVEHDVKPPAAREQAAPARKAAPVPARGALPRERPSLTAAAAGAASEPSRARRADRPRMRVTVKPAARPAPRRATGVPAGSATPQQPAPAAPAPAQAPAAPQSQAPQTTAPPSADPASTTAAAVSDVVEQVRVPVAPLEDVETTVSAVAPPVGEVVGDVRAALTPKQP